jgi:hypothetical protein
MTEDEILARIGKHVRDEQKDDPRFERVARGDATPEELAELTRAAEADREAAVRLLASRPFEPSAADRIAKRIARKPDVARRSPQSSATVVPLFRRAMVLAAPLAVAAAAVVYVAAGPRAGRGPELPAYSVVATGEQAMRGPAEASTRLRIGNGKEARFEVIARPIAAASAKVVGYAFVMSSGEASALDGKVEVSSDGAVRVTGPSRALSGANEIRLVVGAPEAIGKFDDALARAKSGSSDVRVRVLTVAIDHAAP